MNGESHQSCDQEEETTTQNGITTPLNPSSDKQENDNLLAFDWGQAREETRLLVWDLAIPQTLLQLGLISASALTASFVGRTMGPLYLDGFTLGNLTGNIFVTSLLQGIFSASDTLSPQAFGAGNHRELGLLAIRGTVASFVVALPMVLLLWNGLEGIFLKLDQDAQVAHMAAQWFRVFCIGLPAYSVSMMMWRFLSAQNLMFPQVCCGVVANLIVLPICLEVFTMWLGFLGSAAAISAFSIIHTLLLWAYLWRFQPHHVDSWPGLCWAEALAWDPMIGFLKLGLGGMLCFVEWIYWEVLVLMAGTLGVIPLSVQTIANMVIEVCAMLPTGLGIAISIRIGNTLSTNVKQAQRISLWSLIIGSIVFLLLSLLFYKARSLLVAIFTDDENAEEGCEEIWAKVSFLHFNVGIYGIVIGIATGLGMQWTLGIASFIVLFLMALPASYYYAIVQDGGLDMIWVWINPPYMLISVVLLLSFLRTDWRAIAAEILEREGSESGTEQSDYVKGVVDPENGGYGATDSHKPLVNSPVQPP